MLTLPFLVALATPDALAGEPVAQPAPTVDVENAPAPVVADAEPVAAVADDEDDDDTPKDSVKAEKDALKKGDVTSVEDSKKRRKQVIKTIQRKTFMKLGRYEVGPSLGFVANDPFLNRYIIGGVFDYHATEIFAIEAQLGYAPIIANNSTAGDQCPWDWKGLSCQLVNNNSVTADISRISLHGSLGVSYAPIYGKAAVGRNIIAFDIYGTFGLGAAQTTDDVNALTGGKSTPEAEASASQWHPTTNIGGGARIEFSESFGVRAEVKSMSYIETVSAETLEMKNNLIIQLNASFFFPGMK